MHVCVVCAFLLVTGIVHAQGQKLAKLTLAGPSAAVSNALIHMVDSGALADLAEVVEFVPWRDPDQLRVMALDGRADVLAMPTNVAANLYNRGAKLQLINVSTWGVLWLVSRDPALKSLADLRGKELAMPFRGDMPDIVLQLLAEGQGMDVRKDLNLRYVASPVDAMQLLVMRRVDHALLAEPAASMALRKTGSFPLSVIAPELHRSVDLQKEWGRVFARAARIPQAGIAVMGALRERPELVARIEALVELLERLGLKVAPLSIGLQGAVDLADHGKAAVQLAAQHRKFRLDVGSGLQELSSAGDLGQGTARLAGEQREEQGDDRCGDDNGQPDDLLQHAAPGVGDRVGGGRPGHRGRRPGRLVDDTSGCGGCRRVDDHDLSRTLGKHGVGLVRRDRLAERRRRHEHRRLGLKADAVGEARDA